MTGEKPDKWTCKRCFAHKCPRTHETTGAQDGVSERHRVAPWREGWTRSFPFVCPSGLAPTRPGRRCLGALSPISAGRRAGEEGPPPPRVLLRAPRSGRLSARPVQKAQCRSALVGPA